MILFVGLGNPGEKYKNTRHNAGFLFLDFLADLFRKQGIDVPWSMNSRFKAEVAEFKYENTKIVLLKPQTYMNESGWSVSQYMHWNKIGADKLILIHDDLDIQLGKYKYNTEKSPKVHYGILSVEGYLKTKNFTRLRVGVDNRQAVDAMIPGVSYVIEAFHPEEKTKLQEAFEAAEPEIMTTIKNKMQKKEQKAAE